MDTKMIEQRIKDYLSSCPNQCAAIPAIFKHLVDEGIASSMPTQRIVPVDLEVDGVRQKRLGCEWDGVDTPIADALKNLRLKGEIYGVTVSSDEYSALGYPYQPPAAPGYDDWPPMGFELVDQQTRNKQVEAFKQFAVVNLEDPNQAPQLEALIDRLLH